MDYKILIFLIGIFVIKVNGNVPVLILGTSSQLSPALTKLDTSDFSKIIKSDIDDSMVLVFTENQLNIEDLTLCKTKTDEKCFENISKIQSKTFYSNVKNPIEGIREVSSNREHVVISNDGILEREITYEVGKIVFYDFEMNENEDNRNEQLQMHDAQISKIYNILSSTGKVIVIYTGKDTTSSIRKTRQVSEQSVETNSLKKDDPEPITEKPEKPIKDVQVHNISDTVYMAFIDLEIKKVANNNDTEKFDLGEATLENKNDTSVEVKLTDKSLKNTITFVIIEKAGYWSIVDLKLNNDLMKFGQKITISKYLSYYCSAPLKFHSEKSGSIIWTGLQIQPNFKNDNSSQSDAIFRFSDPWHCVGFTSPAIWSGIFVTFMMLFILSIGISWMLDINTMDRFDDPKGKTIIVNVSE